MKRTVKTDEIKSLMFTHFVVSHFGSIKRDKADSFFMHEIAELLNNSKAVDSCISDLLLNSKLTLEANKHVKSKGLDSLLVEEVYKFDSVIQLKLFGLIYSGHNRTFKRTNRPIPRRSLCDNQKLDLPRCFLGISKVWNFIRFYYPYRSLINLNRQEIDVAINHVLKNNNSLKERYYYSLIVVSSMTNDCHNRLELCSGEQIEDLITKKFYPKFGITLKHDNVIVTKSSVGTVDHTLQVGDTIIRINGQNISKAMDYYQFFYPCHLYDKERNDWIVKNLILSGNSNQKQRCSVIRDGDTLDLSYTTSITSNHSSRSPNSQQKRALGGFYRINDSIVYVGANLSRSEFKELKRTNPKHIIFDCRVYPSKSSWKVLTGCSKKQSEIYLAGKTIAPSIVKYKPVRLHISLFSRLSKRFYSSLYVIHDESTSSWGESVVLAANEMKNNSIVTIGTNTSGTLGEVGYFHLPGQVIFSTTVNPQKMINGDFLQYQGIKPDYYLSDISENPILIWYQINQVSKTNTKD